VDAATGHERLRTQMRAAWTGARRSIRSHSGTAGRWTPHWPWGAATRRPLRHHPPRVASAASWGC